MTVERITVSLPHELLEGVRSAVDAGAADSLSAFVADVPQDRLNRDHALTELARVLGGPPPFEAQAAVHRAWGLPAPVDAR
jgi:metal-responsive CopG/Arc/MetJ family transcriptional regulator